MEGLGRKGCGALLVLLGALPAVHTHVSGIMIVPFVGMLWRDPPDHTRLRRLVQRSFGPAAIREWTPRIEQIARRLLAEGLELAAAGQDRRGRLVRTEVELGPVGRGCRGSTILWPTLASPSASCGAAPRSPPARVAPRALRVRPR